MQEIVKKFILQRLVNANVWGGKHTPLDFVVKGLPEHFRNTHKGQRAIDKSLKNLVNEGLVIILLKKTGKGNSKHISLNPRKVAEIKRCLEVQD
ncbi:MAG TPA: hypothetical protein VJB94_04620 [Candidatus Nanoarchaeia archaeon]|nr:hypothetical protein [Candidatus Nanoarchaeia archaeon]